MRPREHALQVAHDVSTLQIEQLIRACFYFIVISFLLLYLLSKA